MKCAFCPLVSSRVPGKHMVKFRSIWPDLPPVPVNRAPICDRCAREGYAEKRLAAFRGRVDYLSANRHRLEPHESETFWAITDRIALSNQLARLATLTATQ